MRLYAVVGMSEFKEHASTNYFSLPQLLPYTTSYNVTDFYHVPLCTIYHFYQNTHLFEMYSSVITYTNFTSTSTLLKCTFFPKYASTCFTFTCVSILYCLLDFFVLLFPLHSMLYHIPLIPSTKVIPFTNHTKYNRFCLTWNALKMATTTHNSSGLT